MKESSINLLRKLNAALRTRDRSLVNRLCADLISLEDDIGNQWKAVSEVLQFNGEFLLADEALDLWARYSPENVHISFSKATLAANAGWSEAALQRAACLGAGPTTPISHIYLQAMLAIDMGRFENGKELLRSLITVEQKSGQTYLALAMAGPVSEADGRCLVSAKEKMVNAPLADQITYNFALGKLMIENGDFRSAINAYEAGSSLQRGLIKYDLAADRAAAEISMDGWDIQKIRNEFRARKSPSDLVFIAGLPRSGTTLVEQILLSHSNFAGGRELGIFEILERDIGGKGERHFSAYCASNGSVKTARDLYEHLIRQRIIGSGVKVDKTLTSSRYVGLIATLFPSAPIIWVRRQPLECAWSVYRTYFSSGMNWAYSQSDIANHFKVEDRLFNFWTKKLGDRILVVNYEDLVSDPENYIPSMMEYCGLTVESAQMVPERRVGSVQTASVAQVRRPINMESVSVPPQVRTYMAPFIQEYYTA